MTSNPPLRCRRGGFTLIELLIAVAIVGILATLATYMFTRQTAKAKAAEVSAVFAEIAARQEAYQLENGAYTCLTATPGDSSQAECNDTDLFPDDAPTKNVRSFTETGTDWERLKMRVDKGGLLCTYASVSGTANDGTNITGGSIAATEFNYTSADVPEADGWYYMVAKCNLDGDDSEDSFYFQRSDTNGTAAVNQGK